MPDSSDIDAALVAKLGADATLLALMPNGVYVDTAPPNSTRYVLVSVIDAHDETAFATRTYEDIRYLVKAVGYSPTSPNVKGAAARIDELLERVPLTVAGFTWMTTIREQR